MSIVFTRDSLNPSPANAHHRYFGVERQVFPPLWPPENSYAPSMVVSAKGEPMANMNGVAAGHITIPYPIEAPKKNQSMPASEEAWCQAPRPNKKEVDLKSSAPQPVQRRANRDKPVDAKPAGSSIGAKPVHTTGASGRNPAGNSQTSSPSVKGSMLSAMSNVERDVLDSFRSLASQAPEKAQSQNTRHATEDRDMIWTEFKKISNYFKLSKPIPSNLVPIITKDPAKQKLIQARAINNAEEAARRVKKVDKPGREVTKLKRAIEGVPKIREDVALEDETYGIHTGGPQHVFPQQQACTLAQQQPEAHDQTFRAVDKNSRTGDPGKPMNEDRNASATNTSNRTNSPSLSHGHLKNGLPEPNTRMVPYSALTLIGPSLTSSYNTSVSSVTKSTALTGLSSCGRPDGSKEIQATDVQRPVESLTGIQEEEEEDDPTAKHTASLYMDQDGVDGVPSTISAISMQLTYA